MGYQKGLPDKLKLVLRLNDRMDIVKQIGEKHIPRATISCAKIERQIHLGGGLQICPYLLPSSHDGLGIKMPLFKTYLVLG